MVYLYNRPMICLPFVCTLTVMAEPTASNREPCLLLAFVLLCSRVARLFETLLLRFVITIINR
jgi:hypothetical protein